MDNKIKLFIVEDEKDIADLYELKFKKEGFDVKVAYNWLDFLTMIQEFLPEVILLDIMMPGMNGFETISAIRQLAPSLKNTKIIMFSNLNSEENIKKAMEFWADDYLLKADNTPKEVLEKVKNMLDKANNKKNDNTKKNVKCPYCWGEF